MKTITPPPAKTKRKFKKRYYLYIFITLLLIIRLWMPYAIKNTLVSAINSVEGYSCTIEDIDLNLYRGAMIIQNMNIFLTDKDVEEPYISIKNADIAVEFGALFDGSLVGKILVTQPVIHFYDGETESEQQVGNVSWVDPILDFIPLKINQLEIIDGAVKFDNVGSSPPVSLAFSKLKFLATNLTNSKDVIGTLPSDITLEGQILESGSISISGKMNILKDIPDMDIVTTINNLNLVELNEFAKAYAHFDFESGTFKMVSEIALKDGAFKGYLKPVLSDVKIFKLDEKGSLRNKAWQGFLGVMVGITKNQFKNQTGTTIPISGHINDIKFGLLSTIFGIFKNGIFGSNIESNDSVEYSDFEKKPNVMDKIQGVLK